LKTSRLITDAWTALGRRLDTERGLRAALARRLASKTGFPSNARNIETILCRWFHADHAKTPTLFRAVIIFRALEAYDRDDTKGTEL